MDSLMTNIAIINILLSMVDQVSADESLYDLELFRAL